MIDIKMKQNTEFKLQRIAFLINEAKTHNAKGNHAALIEELSWIAIYAKEIQADAIQLQTEERLIQWNSKH